MMKFLALALATSVAFGLAPMAFALELIRLVRDNYEA